MAEANLPASGSSSGQFDRTPITPEQFNKLSPFDQREEYERIYDLYTMSNERSKSQSNDTKRGRLQEEEDWHDSSLVDQMLVDRQSANPNEKSLVEALKVKDVRYATFEQKASGYLRDLQDKEQQLQNALARIDAMKSMETEKILSASVANCDNFNSIQVDNLRDELKDRDVTIRIMAQSTQRDQERNAELSAHLGVLRSGKERVEAENRTLTQQLDEEMLHNQILRNLLQMIARRSLQQARRPLRQGRPRLLIIQPLSLPATEVIPDSLG